MENNEIKRIIESWLSLHEDHTVRIKKFNEADIVACNIYDYDCNMGLTPFEYVEYVPYCPCCEEEDNIYHNVDEIDFSGRKLSFEDSRGKKVMMYDVANKVTTWSSDTELSQQEIDDFFDKHWESVCSWSEGEGRGQSHYEIMSDGAWTRIISVQHYGFGDFMEPKYFLINH